MAAVGAASCAFVLPVTPALAGSHHPAPMLSVAKTLSDQFVGPLQFAVSGRRVVVADSFTSTLWEIGRSTPLATGPSPATGGDLAGVALGAGGRSFAYTTSTGDHSSTGLTIRTNGRKPVVADLSGFESRVNPDRTMRYGVSNPSRCVADALAAAEIPADYTGTKDSHPYAVAALDRGAWAVADAGGNDVLKVDRYGRVSVIAVLPAQPATITAEMAAELKLPSCVVGITYRFEAVPTDVEAGPHGALYVTTLPGGPEGPSSGARGSVYRIDRNGHTARVATGFAGATNLAVDPRGTVYVAELGAGRISKVECGRTSTVAELPGVVAVEYANGHLYASLAPALSGGQAPGSVVVLGPAQAS